MRPSLSKLIRYGGAACIALAAILATALLRQLGESPSIYVFAYPAVLATAWFSGTGPAFLATALTSLIIPFAFFPPYYAFKTIHPAEGLGLGIFAITGVLIGVFPTATRRKRNSLIRQYETRLADLFENSLDAIMFTKPDGRILSANPAACQMFGRSEEELKMLGREGLLVDDENLRGLIKHREKTGSARGMLGYRHANGTIGTAELTSRMFIDRDGTASTIIVARDMSEQKRIENALRLSQETFSAIANLSPDVISIISQDGKLLFNSAAAERIHGYTQADLMGKNTVEFIHPDDRAYISNKLGELTTKPDGIVSAQYRYRNKDGSYKWMEAVAYNKFQNDQIKGILCLSRDISERKQFEDALRDSQDRWRRAFDQSPIGAAIVGLDYRFVDVNAALCEMTGYEKHELLGTGFPAITHPDDVEKDLEQAEQLRSGEIDQYQMEKRYIRKDREVIWVLLSARMLCDSNGRPKYFLPMIQDITDRKKLEAELRAAIAGRDDFLSIASHELRTPLTALDLQLQLTQRRIAKLCKEHPEIRDVLSPPNTKGPPPWEQSATQLKRLGHLLNELLDVTRIRAQKLVLQKSPVDLCKAASEAIAAVREEVASTGATISLNYPPGGDGTIVGQWDPNRIQQIFNNLLSNAIKYGDRGPISVEVSASGNTAFIKVKDTGKGIPGDMLERIFERFERAHHKRGVSGLGLGLYIVRQVTEAHGGTITVESQMGKGSVFTVALPMNSSAAEETTSN